MGFFTGGGATLSFGDTRDPSSFPQFGNRWRGGQIIDVRDVTPQTDMTTGQVIVDGNGRPKEQLPVVLLCDGSGPAAQAGMRTDERNPNDRTDTGQRTSYIKGSLRFSVGDALRAAQADDIEIGGYLFLMWTGMGKVGNSKFTGRQWQVHYIKPSGAFLQQTADAASPGVGAMPVQHNGQGQGQHAPQHTGFVPTQTPVTAPPQQGWNAAPSAPVTPPNPYGQHNPPQSPAGQAAQQWAAQQVAPRGYEQSVPAHGAQQSPVWDGANPDVGTPGGYAAPPQGQQQMTHGAPPSFPPVPDQHYAPPAENHAPGSTPWGAAPEQPPAPPTPYGPPQGSPATPPAGNPWER